MVIISHKQARHLVRIALDGRLPNDQWTTLQVHLENCRECRAYQQGLGNLEKNLGRALRRGWSEISGPDHALSQAVLLARQAWTRRSRLAAAAGLAAILFGLVFLFRDRLIQPDPSGSGQAIAALPTYTPEPTSLPTATQGQVFRGVMAVEMRRDQRADGDRDVYLMNVTGRDGALETTNLTDHPADDHDPAWSPDGEWIAFLSDRDGKTELYVLHISGARLTQLTSEPDVAWSGPLSWSHDGNWIALSGRRVNQAGEKWIYVVPVTGQGPRAGSRQVLGPISVAESRGAGGALRFAPRGWPYLLYHSPQHGGSISLYEPYSGFSETATAEDNLYRKLSTGVNGAFDYFIHDDGYAMVYLAEEPREGVVPPSHDFLVPAMHIRLIDYHNRTGMDYRTLETGPPGAFHSVSFLPGGEQVAYLKEQVGLPVTGGLPDQCRTLHIRSTSPSQDDERSVGGLCIIGRLEPSAWAWNPAGENSDRWLTLFARQVEERSASLFALYIPEGEGDIVFQHVASSEGMVGQPQVRPTCKRLDIEPQAVRKRVRAPEPVRVPDQLRGEVLFVRTLGMNSAIEGVRPDGSGRRVIIPAEAANTCPTWQPPGDRRLAYVSNRDHRLDSGNELYLASTGGGKPVQLTSPGSRMKQIPGSRAVQFDCPVWSPDGSRLAAVGRYEQGTFLAIVPVAETGAEPAGGLPRAQSEERYQNEGDLYLPLEGPLSPEGLSWAPDGQGLLMALSNPQGGTARISQVDWQGGSFREVSSIPLYGWDNIQGFSVSPDGQYIGVIQTRRRQEGRRSTASLRVISLENGRVSFTRELAGYDPDALPGPARVFWLDSRQVAFAVPTNRGQRIKATLQRYSPADDTLTFLAYLEDMLYDWTLKGGWLVYSTESGLWGNHVKGRFDELAAPIRLAGDKVFDLEWQ